MWANADSLGKLIFPVENILAALPSPVEVRAVEVYDLSSPTVTHYGWARHDDPDGLCCVMPRMTGEPGKPPWWLLTDLLDRSARHFKRAYLGNVVALSCDLVWSVAVSPR